MLTLECPRFGWKPGFCFVALIISVLIATGVARAQPADVTARPNIVVIYSDDVGWGDLSCYGATRVSTPHIDQLAAGGVRFTDAHTTASTCTPSRYSILTGQYPFRRKGAQILAGDATMLITPDTPTLPQILKSGGYRTGCVGKWHLGLGDGSIDWNGQINRTPLDIGFDESFIIPATPDRVPCVYVEGRQVVGLNPADPVQVKYLEKVGNEPTGREQPGALRFGADDDHSGTIVDRVSRMGYMAGGQSARWRDDQMSKTLVTRAEQFLTRSADQPFFLYFALADIHVPRVPHPDFVGKSQCGVRGDQILEMDWAVGQIMAKLEALNLKEKTLVLFSSDNGPILFDGYQDGAIKDLNGHKPGGPYRGGKYDLYEGGTRVPFITYWPGHTKAGVSDALVSQVDLLNSLASIAGTALPQSMTVDGQNLQAAFLDPTAAGRESLLEQAGTDLAVRKGKWKLIPAGVRRPFRSIEEGEKRIPRSPPSPSPRLFDLSADPGEQSDLAAAHPEIVAELSRLLPLRESKP
jgi:arylsulfatase A-like enzyme